MPTLPKLLLLNIAFILNTPKTGLMQVLLNKSLQFPLWPQGVAVSQRGRRRKWRRAAEQMLPKGGFRHFVKGREKQQITNAKQSCEKGWSPEIKKKGECFLLFCIPMRF